MDAKNLFSSKQVEEEAKKESAKTFTPGEAPQVPQVSDSEEERVHKVAAPTPEQITAIKVLSFIILISKMEKKNFWEYNTCSTAKKLVQIAEFLNLFHSLHKCSVCPVTNPETSLTNTKCPNVVVR